MRNRPFAQLAAVTLLALFASSCHAGGAAVRQPTQRERARIATSVSASWRYEAAPPQRIRTQATLAQPIASPDLHALYWREVTLPGGACRSSRPIRPHRYEYGPAALIHPDVDLLWWNPVVVGSWSKPVFGDLDGDGRDE